MAVRDQRNVSNFGALLRQHRTLAGWSQEELAERAGLSTRAISDLERGVKIRPHPATMRALADALALESGDRTALAAASRPGATPMIPAPVPNDLPIPHTRIVGREREMATSLHILRSGASRLLTLTGPGGVGKTRLSLEIAHALASECTDGAIFVELAPVTDPSLVTATVAAALKLRESAGQSLSEAIREHLRSRNVLIILDNCEHLLDETGKLVAFLVSSSAGLRILATSRSPLHLRGEQTLPITPLDVAGPDDDTRDMDRLASIPAIDLFIQRAHAVQPDFTLTERNIRHVSEICRRVDGLPLAIELAANRIRVLSPSALEGLLSKRLRLLTDGPADAPVRQQTLRAAITWSHDLLSSEQQATFRKLAVFAGGCTLDAITGVLKNDPFTTIENIEVLIDMGLLFRAENTNDTRFRMLETIREYAQERLDASGESTPIHAAHAAYMLTFANQAGAMLQGSNPGPWLDRLEGEQDNFRAALTWALDGTNGGGDPATALKLAAALYQFWHMRGHLQEGNRWLERAIARGGEVDPSMRSDALLTLANIANNLEDHTRAKTLYQQSLLICEQTGSRHGAAAALVGLGMVATSEGEYDRAEEFLQQGLAIYQDTSHAAGTLAGFYASGRLCVARARYDDAERHFEEARHLSDTDNIGIQMYLSLERAQLERYRGNMEIAAVLANECLAGFRKIGERRAEATCLAELGYLEMHANVFHLAAERFRTATAIHLELRDEYGVVRCLEGIAMLATHHGDIGLAESLTGTVNAWRSRTNTIRISAEQQAHDRLIAALQEKRGREFLQEGGFVDSSADLDQAVTSANALIAAMLSDKSSREADRPR